MKTILLGIATFLLSCNGPIQKVNEYIGHAEAKLPVEILIEGMPDVAYWDVVNGAAILYDQDKKAIMAQRFCVNCGYHYEPSGSGILKGFGIYPLDNPEIKESLVWSS